jgi:hypothetical protein
MAGLTFFKVDDNSPVVEDGIDRRLAGTVKQTLHRAPGNTHTPPGFFLV